MNLGFGKQNAGKTAHFACFLFTLLTLLVMSQPPAHGDVIQEWNRVLSETLRRDVAFQNPGMASRSMAMTNIAMYDALNAVSPNHRPFYSHDVDVGNASAEVAALQAGYRVLASIYPAQEEFLDAQRSSILDALPNSDAITAGIQLGDIVGTNVVDYRMNDGYMNMVNYMPTIEPGHWQPDPLNPSQVAWGPEWGQIKPFGVSDMSTVMPPAMPALTSQDYTEAFNEVKSLGAVDSTTRTPDQTEAGIFWAYDRVGMGTPMRLYIDILDIISAQEENSLSENAKLYAVASTAIADAGIVAWDAKFKYDFWRPVSGIRQADVDGNPDTLVDPDWTPLGAPGGTHPDGSPISDFTPPFPTYVSGHASFGGALFGALEEFYGTDEISFSLQSEELPGVTRNFDTLSEAMAENGRSRVYLGIHWDFDDYMARNVGDLVAADVMQNHFAAVPEPGAIPLLSCVLFVAFRLRSSRNLHHAG